MSSAFERHSPGDILTLSDVASLLDLREYIGIMHQQPGETFVTNEFIDPKFATAVVSKYADRNCWYGVNEVAKPPEGNKRATVQNVASWRALVADLDVKPDGCPDMDTANRIIDDVSAIYGARPTFITHSGHGLQPVWVLTRDDETELTAPDRRQRAVALNKRHGRLVSTVAERHGAKVDAVFDLPRVLRAPGTLNWKNPAAVVSSLAYRDTGEKLRVGDVRAALDREQVDAFTWDGEVVGDVVAKRSTWLGAATPGECQYVRQMFDSWGGDRPMQGNRHAAALNRATRIEAAHRYGCLTAAETASAIAQLERSFLSWFGGNDRRPTQREFVNIVRDARDLVERKTAAQLETELGGHEHGRGSAAAIEDWEELRRLTERSRPTDTGEAPNVAQAATQPVVFPIPEVIYPDDELERLEYAVDGGFWMARPELASIYAAAMNRLVSPWGLLGAVLARVIARTPWDCYAPGIGGSGVGSLNLMVGLVAPPGSGKGRTTDIAEELYDVGMHTSIVDSGSGEGLISEYGYTNRETGEFTFTNRSVLLDIPEVDSLSAMSSRQGSTSESIYRQAFSGERLGFSYKKSNKDTATVPKKQYRFCALIGIQPMRAKRLFEGEGGGTPQRILWLPITDGRLPYRPTGDALTKLRTTQHYIKGAMPMPDAASDEVWADVHRRAARTSMQTDDDALDAHAMFIRVKVACALAIMADRQFVTDEDWKLAAVVLAVSTMTRERCRDAIKAGRKRDAVDRGEERGIEQAAAKLTMAAETNERAAEVRRRIVEMLADNGPMATGKLTAKLTRTHRPMFATAIQELVLAGLVEAEPGRQAGSFTYSLGAADE